MQVNWLSECCDAEPHGDLDMSTLNHGGPSGFCNRCLDNAIFFAEEDPGDHFDTREEKYGER